jgi:hypothetical protein
MPLRMQTHGICAHVFFRQAHFVPYKISNINNAQNFLIIATVNFYGARIGLERGLIKPACRVNPTHNGAMDANLDPLSLLYPKPATHSCTPDRRHLQGTAGRAGTASVDRGHARTAASEAGPDRLKLADFGPRLSDQATTAASEKGDGILLSD